MRSFLQWMMVGALLLGCAGKENGALSVEDSAVADHCNDATFLSWETFGDGFVTENCQACHASTSPNRNGAPESVSFDSYEQSISHGEQILAVVTSDNPTMPPEGGIDEQTRQQVYTWLTCWEEL